MDTPQQHKSELTQEDLSYDFDRLIDSPDAIDLVNNILQGERKRMNTMTLAEFSQYERLFQYDGQNILGEQAFKDLATQYFRSISIYDPVVVVDGNQVVMELPPIFHRFNPIGTAGQTGADINQAFINACQADDPMAMHRLNKYTEFYKRMISIVNDEQIHQEVKEKAQEQANTVIESLNQHHENVKHGYEIEDIGQSNFKSAEIESLSDNTRKSGNEGNDEFEPL